MTIFLKNPQKRLKRSVIALFGAGTFIAFSTITPIFPIIMGSALEKIGDWYGRDDSTPDAYLVLGGGLTDRQGEISLNIYSKARTNTALINHTKHPLPIIVSGVEAPWISSYLKHHSNNTTLHIITENASMNTCENARFSAKLIGHEVQAGNLPAIRHVFLISDWYHMARARRHLAQLGIYSTPIDAPMPSDIRWNNPKGNLNHSRRAFYEWVALIRDITYPQPNCRQADEVSIETLKTPRGEVKTF